MGIWRSGLLVCLALAGAGGLAQAPASKAPERPPSAKAEAWQIFLHANEARAAQGIAPLRWEPALAEAARKHCLRMTVEGTPSHRYAREPDMTERAGEAGARFDEIEEDLAVDSEPAGIERKWLASGEDRENWLDPKIDSVGVSVETLNGMFYAVADFTHSVPVLTRVEVESAIAWLLRAQGLAIGQDTTDARMLCAGQSMVNMKPSFVMIWQDSDLTKLPADLVRVLAQTHFKKATVGSCPAKDLDGNYNQYRVAALFYSTGVGVY
jgi:hypothetical protein